MLPEYFNIYKPCVYMLSGNQSPVLLISGSVARICMVLAFGSYSANVFPVPTMVALEIKKVIES